MDSSAPLLTLFAKHPTPGRVKTRLALRLIMIAVTLGAVAEGVNDSVGESDVPAEGESEVACVG